MNYQQMIQLIDKIFKSTFSINTFIYSAQKLIAIGTY